MPDSFDPYLEWLGIPVSERPINHYRLLGLTTFESDPRLIQAAADRAMAYVRTFQTGRRSHHSQRLLTEISAAKLCLLDHDTRAMYDAVLRGQLAAASRAAPPPGSPEHFAPPPAPPPVPITPPPLMSPAAMAIPAAAAPYGVYAGAAPLETALSPAASVGISQPAEAMSGESSSRFAAFWLQPWFPVACVAAVCAMVLGVWGLGAAMRGRDGNSPSTSTTPSTPTQVVQPPPAVVEPEQPTTVIMQEAGGEVNFAAGTAQLTGGAKLENRGGQSVITSITSLDDRLRWHFRLEKPAAFRVEATFSAAAGSEGGQFTLAAAGQTTKPITVHATAGDAPVSERIGFLWVRRSGKHELVLTPVLLNDGQPLFTLQSLRLVPVSM